MTLVKTVFLTVKVIDININNGASKLNLFSKLHLVTERNTMVIKNQISVTREGKEKKTKHSRPFTSLYNQEEKGKYRALIIFHAIVYLTLAYGKTTEHRLPIRKLRCQNLFYYLPWQHKRSWLRALNNSNSHHTYCK